MNSYFQILKANFLNSSGINKLIKNKKSRNKFIILIIFIAISIYGIIKSLNSLFEDMPSELLNLGISITFMTSLIIILTKGTSFLFKTNDYEFLKSLPINQKIIFFAKLTSFLLFQYLIELLILIPFIIVYQINSSFDIMLYLNMFLVIILLPLLILSVISILDVLFKTLFRRLKHHQLISTIMQFVFMILFIFIYLTMMGIINIDHPIIDFTKKVFSYLTYPAQMATNIVFSNYDELLLYLLLHLGSFTLYFLLFTFLYEKIYYLLRYNQRLNKFRVEDLKISSDNNIKFLYKREAKRYIKIPIYVINTIVGPLLMISMVLFPNMIEMQGFESSALIFLIPISVLFGNLVLPSTSAISLEGKEFWIIKIAPVSYKELYISKILFSLTFTTVASVISTTLLLILYQEITFIIFILLLIGYLLASIFYSSFGLFLNLLFPKMEFKAEKEVVKRGLSTFISVIFLYVMIAVFIGLILNLKIDSILNISYLIILIFLVLNVILFTLYYFLGEKLYLKIKA